jgi:hypothetical protein
VSVKRSGGSGGGELAFIPQKNGRQEHRDAVGGVEK